MCMNGARSTSHNYCISNMHIETARDPIIKLFANPHNVELLDILLGALIHCDLMWLVIERLNECRTTTAVPRACYSDRGEGDWVN